MRDVLAGSVATKTVAYGKLVQKDGHEFWYVSVIVTNPNPNPIKVLWPEQTSKTNPWCKGTPSNSLLSVVL